MYNNQLTEELKWIISAHTVGKLQLHLDLVRIVETALMGIMSLIPMLIVVDFVVHLLHLGSVIKVR